MDTKLRTFLTVARKASFSGAARELHLSQPAVSMQIQQLEEHYGVRLFDRLDRGIRLTPAGLVFQKYARDILALYDAARGEMMRCTGKIMGELHIGATLTIGEYVLPKLIALFKREYSEVEPILTVENSESIVRGLAEEALEIGFIEGPFHHPKIKKDVLSEDELVLVIAPDHPWGGRESVSVGELLEEQLVVREPGSGTREVFKVALEEAGTGWDQLRVYLELGSTEAIKSVVKAGLGVSVISRWTVRDELQSGDLKALAVEGLELKRNFVVAKRKKFPYSPQAQRFAEFCEENLDRL